MGFHTMLRHLELTVPSATRPPDASLVAWVQNFPPNDPHLLPKHCRNPLIASDAMLMGKKTQNWLSRGGWIELGCACPSTLAHTFM